MQEKKGGIHRKKIKKEGGGPGPMMGATGWWACEKKGERKTTSDDVGELANFISSRLCRRWEKHDGWGKGF